MVKRGILVLVFFIFLIVTALIGGFLWWNENSKAVSTNASKVDFLITKGKGASQIAQELKSEGLIKNPLAFKMYVQVKGYSDKIQAGRYSLSPSLTIPQIAELLIKGPKDIWVTIPEGLRREEIVEKFIEGLEKEGQNASIFRQEFLEASEHLEGFLFPDTYLFPRETKASVVVNKMSTTFDSEMIPFKHVLLDEKAAGGLDLKGIVTLASIIERETKSDDERPVVAGILFNRLDIGMGLQVDATVQYAAATIKCKSNSECNWWPILTRENLLIYSPYNTYKYRGLPPAPIANPGLYSLKAVINSEDTEYLYYLHDSEGNIHYAKSLDEHNENVRKYLGK
ncbi:hypothetical protein A2715_03190 [Candidatus Woesebacteria bacterium RIFCSPHIGHO2_01_FULL_39_32]|uniref:Endolytic murein transglycosylase n=2 Tax=Candidatus Woeseibacteriota TaxID=1752722 RepID=A0A1F8BKT4_9BACT|nr:MAG: hypothetical protein A2124_02860 [Candidatus Woesebacteria bacterium GWB1_37_5]OGM24744.1 MAG: hypothetical protein A2715_03190 [Candidatus Woesebacteria bacterium RIFCSPHIGHO2_01_FULL_39_32]OGM38199.1 MAG: hypothetical protein A3F01_00960 [Candidatus Woesebacteria bacterium RIFCSPHIGHO2_12_FULL_38_11]OGM64570.1 MAG: hypothetical protein A2893_06105 [Candidatus Woesebacteria bacterium RIFCSPLOWO2_01_FULL_39_25]